MSTAFDRLAAPFLAIGALRPADLWPIKLLASRYQEHDPERMLGLAFAARAPRTGHAGVDLSRLAASLDLELLPRRNDEPAVAAPLPWPEAESWLDRCAESPMVGARDDAQRPFTVLTAGDTRLLCTRHMLRDQERLAAALLARVSQPVAAAQRRNGTSAVIATLFADDPDGEAAKAVRLAEAQRLAIVVGGPGTGKTYSLTRLLAALLAGEGAPPRIELAAPTGKAAVRMQQAILESVADPHAAQQLGLSAAAHQHLLALRPKTLHRLLGIRPDGSCRHHLDNPLMADLVVVDEVSMVDLVTMRRLLEALPRESRLVLLGDRDQLASVEVGSVLADIVGEPERAPLEGFVQSFSRSRRFASAPDIALTAACLQSYRSDNDEVPQSAHERLALSVALCTGQAHARREQAGTARIEWLGAPAPDPKSALAAPTPAQLERLAEPYWRGVTVWDGATPRQLPGYLGLLKQQLGTDGRWQPRLLEPSFQRQLLDAFEHYRVLAVHRRGALGVEGLERAIATRARQELGLYHRGARPALGQPLMVKQNDYELGLMNGDIGLVLPHEGPDLAVVFPAAAAGAVRAVPLSRLPPHEGAFAMTVHKSQGSQFDSVALVLAGRSSPIQTRELIYTGITRAKSALLWLGAEPELREALERRITRASALGSLLLESRATTANPHRIER